MRRRSGYTWKVLEDVGGHVHPGEILFGVISYNMLLQCSVTIWPRAPRLPQVSPDLSRWSLTGHTSPAERLFLYKSLQPSHFDLLSVLPEHLKQRLLLTHDVVSSFYSPRASHRCRCCPNRTYGRSYISNWVYHIDFHTLCSCSEGFQQFAPGRRLAHRMAP